MRRFARNDEDQRDGAEILIDNQFAGGRIFSTFGHAFLVVCLMDNFAFVFTTSCYIIDI
jgi:hypothetical protein